MVGFRELICLCKAKGHVCRGGREKEKKSPLAVLVHHWLPGDGMEAILAFSSEPARGAELPACPQRWPTQNKDARALAT